MNDGAKGPTRLPVLDQLGFEGAIPMDRRQAIKVMAIAAAAVPTFGACAPEGSPGSSSASTSRLASNSKAAGTLWDPDLVSPVVPWERILASDELESLATLCDLIIPADHRSSSARDVGAQDFIDEWVSAPYAGNSDDLALVRGGLVWLDEEAAERFGDGLRFRNLSAEQQAKICDDICYLPEAAAGHEEAARFFDRVRDLTATAFWTTQVGMDDLQYIGNVPLAQWDPPPPDVLRHLGLA